jgi:SAM-dependent methyltransferase
LHGSEIYPLRYQDQSVDVVRASHVLEHFSHRVVDDVIKDWVRVLKPGGVLKIAVPDLVKITAGYLEGKSLPAPIEWVLFGSQKEGDPDDVHKSGFDSQELRKRMSNAGLVLLRPWVSEIKDCAEYPISLNLEGTKPFVSEIKVSAAMSVPRLGFMDNFGCAFDSLVPLGIKLRRQGGAFWGQALGRCLEIILEEDKPDAVLTLDYDTVFNIQHVAHMMQLMICNPQADALAPIQSSRHKPTPLISERDEDGKPRSKVPIDEFDPDLKKIMTAHFGLTLIRADKLAALPHPWFDAEPDEHGRWSDDGKIDEDINFWHKWNKAGNSLYLCNHVAIGHAELMVRWPGRDLQAIYQPIREFNDTRRGPDDVWI